MVAGITVILAMSSREKRILTGQEKTQGYRKWFIS